MPLSPQLGGEAELAVSDYSVRSPNIANRADDRVSGQCIAALGLFGFAIAWFVATAGKVHTTSLLVITYLSLTGMPMAIASIIGNRTHLRPTSGLSEMRMGVNRGRVRIKLIGLFGTIATLSLLYYVIPEYSRPFYRPFWDVVVLASLPALCLIVPYVLWIDCRMRNPNDGYFQAGLFFLGRASLIDRKELRLYALSWAVKGFFLPFMIAGAADRLNVLTREGLNFSTFGYLYSSSVNLTYTVDVVFGAIGYLLTLRILDAQIKSVETTTLGWLCTISCYVPFSTIIWSNLLSYKGKTNWYDWLVHYPVLCITWGFSIILLHVVYVWSTCSFGCHFSNLTNRGIITHGPYRYLKHPAYLSKNAAWWLMSVPFVAHHTFGEAARACLCLFITNCIYAVRAWTEERHLLKDPSYQLYSKWITQHGLGSRIRTLWNRPRSSTDLTID